MKEKDSSSKDKKESSTERIQQTSSDLNIEKFTGTYVNGSYDKRAEGYDWVGVMVSKWCDSTLFIKVRSRTDQKKAACTYMGLAKMINLNTFEGMNDAGGVLFRFTKDSVIILTRVRARLRGCSIFVQEALH